MDSKQKSVILITCSAGLVDYVRREVEDLGYQVGESHKTGLEVEGDLVDTMRLNLYLRTAHNVLFLLKQFKCNGPDELYRNTKNLSWEEIISPQEYLSVVGRVNTELVDNSMYANLKVKDAIVKGEDACTITLPKDAMVARDLKNLFTQGYLDMKEAGATRADLKGFLSGHSQYHAQSLGDVEGSEICCGQVAGLISRMARAVDIIRAVTKGARASYKELGNKLGVLAGE